MKQILTFFFDRVHRFSGYLGWTAGLLILVIMFMTTFEVIARYSFNAPSIWVWPLNRQFFGVFILFSGIYTMSLNAHIRIEIIYERFGRRLKIIAGIITLSAFLCFMGALIWQGYKMGINAWIVREKASGVFSIPLYPLKMFIPVAAVIFIFEGIYVFVSTMTSNYKDKNGKE